MRPSKTDANCPTGTKVELVLRLLAGETVAELAGETGRPRKQLSAWRRRFLAGGEAYLEVRQGDRASEARNEATDQLVAQVAALEVRNRMLTRQLDLLARESCGRGYSHPFRSETYARALEEGGASRLRVREWDTHVLVREGPAGTRQAVGTKPYASLDPGCQLQGGLEQLREEGITSVSLVTDPMWSPALEQLEHAFDRCHPFKECYLVDRAAPRASVSKRHRNKVNKARRTGKVQDISMTDSLDRWFELYRENVARRGIPQPFGEAYFESLAGLAGLRALAFSTGEELTTITLWVEHEDVFYFLDAASNSAGHANFGTYLAFDHAVRDGTDCRYVFFGGSADFYNDQLDGLAKFKRGFSNGSLPSYLCSALLRRPD